MSKLYKHIFFFSLVLIVLGCYEDDSQLLESTNAAHRSSELTPLIKSITLHDASFDDLVDKTSCFSLVFPYQLKVNSRVQRMDSAHEISDLDEDDTIEIIFPVSVVFSNYNNHEVISNSEFNTIKNLCENEERIQTNSCFDFVYPVSIKEYNEQGSTFETLTFDNNKALFLYLDHLHDSDVYEIDFPISLLNSDSRSITINSNLEFIEALETSSSDCN